jgi:SAM-dependent methyltransferase
VYRDAVSFNVAAESYDRFMGRYSRRLSAELADLAGVAAGQRALDVGCGPGALTTELVGRLGAERVAAVDPSEPFVAAIRERLPGVEVRQASADALPFPGATFDATFAQLVVHFLRDPVGGLREMARVTRPGGAVATSVWDHASDHGPLGVFWAAARADDPSIHDESQLPGARAGHLEQLASEAGLLDIRSAALWVEVDHPTFEEWWAPFTEGVGPAGAHVASIDPGARDALRDRCRAILGAGPFQVRARAWAAVGTVPPVG